MAELEDKIALAAPLEWLAEELLVVDTAGPNPATWPVLKAYPLQARTLAVAVRPWPYDGMLSMSVAWQAS